MKILIFGATGHTGQELVKQALARGHSVTAFARSPEKLRVSGAQLRVVQGTLDPESMLPAIEGQDAVASALGASGPWTSSPAQVTGIRKIVECMERKSVGRLVYQSALGVGDSRDDLGFLVRNLLVPILLRRVFAEHLIAEDAIRASKLNWTIVRPTNLTNGPAQGSYHSGPHIKDATPLGRLPRADVADFMLQEIEQERDIRQAVNLVNGPAPDQ